MAVIAVSVCLCSVLFAVARGVRDAVETEMIRSGAANVMEVSARPDKEYRKPWSAAPISTDDPPVAIERLLDLLDEEMGTGVMTAVEPAWLSPGWVYMFLTHPDNGGTPVSVGVSLTSITDPEQNRVREQRLAGTWVDSEQQPQIVIPKKIADRLWQDVLFVGEQAWLGITETSTCVQVTVAGIYRGTQRNYAFANEPVAAAVQAALEEQRAPEEGDGEVAAGGAPTALRHDRVRVFFENRRALLRARNLVEERYKFWAATPYDKFESKLRLAETSRIGAWVVFAITLGSACGAIFCIFLAWVSRRRYEIALLKAQGSGNVWVAGIYILQSGAAGLIAGLVGVTAGWWLCPSLAGAVSRQLGHSTAWTLQLPLAYGVGLVAMAVLVAVAAAAIPARMAALQDPWDILREAA
jgi:hypothetical protein